MIEDDKTKRKVGPSRLNGQLRLLKHMFTMAIKWKKCKSNPVKEVGLFLYREGDAEDTISPTG